MDTNPIVFLLDLDGTLQGNIHPQLVEYELIRELNLIIEQNNEKQFIKYNFTKLSKDYLNGLLRPFLKQAILGMKKKHPNIEFFIYTASTEMWAHLIIPQIERILFGKDELINKPYFTRKHCNSDGSKSIDNVRGRVVSTLRNKYPKSTFEHIYLVDNNIVLKTHELNKLIYCPSYDYKAMNCPIRNLTDEQITKYHREISQELLGKPSIHKYHMLKLYYDNAFKEYEKTEKENEKYIDDDYWKRFSHLVTSSSKMNTDTDILQTIHKLRLLHFPPNFQRAFKQYQKTYVSK